MFLEMEWCISSGSGAKIVSKSCNFVVGDEVDAWDSAFPGNHFELMKRTRSFSDACEVFVCTPSLENAPIWTMFLQGSQGYYTFRCKNCGELSMRACDVNNLQFESKENPETRTFEVVRGSERLVCPRCGYQHLPSDREELCASGEYVHKRPDLYEIRPSFQCGALASTLPSLSWSEIAQAQLDAGRGAGFTEQKSFDNSIRGLPWRQRKITSKELTELKDSHLADSPLNPDDVEMVFITADTMDDFIRWCAFAWDIHDNLWLLEMRNLRGI